jgi:hypothetical protein
VDEDPNLVRVPEEKESDVSTPFSADYQTPPGVTSSVLREVDTYADAQALVDRLSDAGFPVQNVRIVGEGVRTVEQVTGRMTKGKAALLGAGSGAWLGLLIGLLFGLFTVGAAWVYVLLMGLVIGAVWGAVFGFIAHWATRGRRDFSSVRGLEARSYAVMVQAEHLAEAQRLA